ncbi:MAG TPA: hypothetical protein VF148_08400 [Acidimicrobiia bacterium]
MSQTMMFVTHHKVKDGVSGDLQELSRQFVDFVADNEPRTIGAQVFVDDDRNELTYLQIQPDSEAMDYHWVQLQQGGSETLAAALEGAETTSVEIYGEPGPVLTESLKALAERGVEVKVLRRNLEGFLRPQIA